ncbi:MAG: NHLP bacteriocin export ABC transporter permease/ATPase subunit [Aeromicrobium sp.]|nr:NHLP bacteriocin export ABC transporter permease/ATPase subunit [Burkholderiales bacterium]
MHQFWVTDATSAWCVDRGLVMVYLASTDGVELEQPRRYVCDVPSGCVIAAPRVELPFGYAMLCRVQAGAEVRQVAIEALDALGTASKLSIEEWMKGVMRDLDPHGAWLAARRRLARPTVPTAGQESRVFHSRVTTFADMAVERILLNAKQADEREALRLAREQATDQREFAAAMGEISKGVSPDGEYGAPSPNDNDGEGLLGACRFLEPSRQVRFVSARDPSQAEDVVVDTVESIAESSGLRARQVLLNGSWWDEEGGPMLARLSDNELAAGEPRHWVALLPGQVSGYRIYSARPLGNIACGAVVTEAIAHRLAPFAFTFYRTFPNKKLSALDIVRFGIQGKAKDVWTLLLASLLAGLLGLLVPVVSGKIIDRVIPANDHLLLFQYISGLLVAGLSVLLFNTLRTVAVLRIEARAGIAVHAAILDRVISLPVTFFRKFSSGDLSVRMSAVNSIQHAVTGSTIGTILTSIFLIGNLALMLWYSVKLTMVVLMIVALLFLVSSVIGYARLLLARQIEDIGGKIQSLVFEYLTGISKIRTSASETRAFVNWTERFIKLRRLCVRSESLANAEALLLNILLPAMMLIVYFNAAQAVQATDGGGLSKFSTGDFIAFNAALFSLVGGLYGLLTTAIDLVQLLPVWERARPIVETLPEASGRRNAVHEPLGSIEIANLGFRYAEGPKVLDDVSFNVAPGTFVALVGSSGSGKSTLIRLLLGFEQPTAGSICFDGHDLAGLNARRLRSRIGTVLQGGQLWQGDIYSNIAGASRIPVEQVWEAARIAGLKDDIEKMPMGLYTTIGDGDSTLSGGQRQRILIARAVVHQPRILLMDEATAALDNLTQQVVQQGLAEMQCTRLVIAHRLSTVRQADTIIVLEQGKLVEQGTFDRLAANGGAFAALLQRQLA